MNIPIKMVCSECDAPGNVISLQTFEHYCCVEHLAEGEFKFYRWALRVQAELAHVG